MRQLITRIDDALHARLKERARAAGLSVNAYVTAALDAAVSREDARADLKRRLQSAGRLALPERDPGPIPSRDDVIDELRGAGDVVLRAIEAGRAPR